MVVAKQKVVQIHYELKNKDGQVMDSSAGRDPLVYIHGMGNLIPGLEAELEGKEKGAKLLAVIPPEQAYGEPNDNKIIVVSKSGFQGTEELQAGMQVQLDTDQGPAMAVITKIEGESVTLDANHPLAGETLYFDVEVVEIRDADAEEVSHGHVHGPGGHHH